MRSEEGTLPDPAARDVQDVGTWLDTEHYVSPGARKEKLREREYRPARATRRRYAELHCA